jgi:hypothetical protein
MNRLWEVIKHPLDAERFHRLLSRKQWYVSFNVMAIVWAIVTGRLRWSAKSIIIAAFALAVMNTIAHISGRNYPDWK